jgi:exodeoxyribonuclease-5
MPLLILIVMLENYIISLLSGSPDFQLTESQGIMVEKLADFIIKNRSDTIFLIRGYAGTGKTTMINRLVKTLDVLQLRSVLLAPTGRAAKVLSGYTGKDAYTIHRKIYRQKSTANGIGTFVLDQNLHKNATFIVDEASMISNLAGENSVFGSGRLLDDLLEYVYSGEGCRLVLVGDNAQLPPVGASLSPALDKRELENNGFTVSECELTDVVRQENESAILCNATRLRDKIFHDTFPGDFFRIELGNSADIFKIQGNELTETISGCYDRDGITETIVLTRSNKRANLFNKGIRSSILNRDSEISRGDLLMVVKNNYFWIKEEMNIGFIANGDIGEIVHIYGYEKIYGFRFANISLRLPDYNNVEIDCKIILDSIYVESASLSGEDQTRLFLAISEDYADIRNKRERWKKIRIDPYFNAIQVKFAYAVTCHKALGGQWRNVFVDTGYLTEEMMDREFYRWLYTAFTRPTKKLYLLNFDKRFFGDEG